MSRSEIRDQAFKPAGLVIPYLTRTLRQSGVGVELMSKAASARSGTATLAIDRNWSGLSSIAGVHKEFAGQAIEFVEVPTVTLATLIKERTADVRSVRLLVKIDVEIHEVAVLQGLEDMLAEFEEFAALVKSFTSPPPTSSGCCCALTSSCSIPKAAS